MTPIELNFEYFEYLGDSHSCIHIFNKSGCYIVKLDHIGGVYYRFLGPSFLENKELGFTKIRGSSLTKEFKDVTEAYCLEQITLLVTKYIQRFL